MHAIEVQNLSKTYPGFVLDQVSFSLPQGTVLGLVGENGAGKSTTINLLMNAVKPDSGSIQVLGTDTQSRDFCQLKNEIGVVLDEACFPEVLTPKNVNVVMRHTYRDWDEARFFQYLNQFRLPETKVFRDFSRGMKMKLAIAVALSHNPKLLILDEATSGLDPMMREEILDLFNDFMRDETNSILISSHIVSDLEKICDYIAFLHKGKLLFCEEKDRLLEKYAIVKMTAEDFAALPKTAVKGFQREPYGVQALVYRAHLPAGYTPEFTNLENIILFFAKEGVAA